MFTRISEAVSIAILSVLAACEQQDAAPPPPDPKAPDTVLCRVNGAKDMAPLCRRENERDQLTIRHSDGGFRRFVVVDDGRGIVTADGAETAQIEQLDSGRIRVTVGSDAYDLPATFVAAP